MKRIVTVPVGPTAAPVAVSPAGFKCSASSTGAAVLSGINLPSKADQDAYAVFNGDGSATSFSSADIPCLANATVLDTAGNTAAATLGVVAKANGAFLKRIGSDDLVATGEFAVVTGARAVATVTFTDQPADEDTVILIDTAEETETFEFDSNASATGTAVDIESALADTITNFVAAVNDSTTIAMIAVDNGDDTVTLYQTASGAAGNSDITVSSTNVSADDAFTGGSDTGVTIEFGDVYDSTDKLELIVGQTITTAAALTANTEVERTAYDIMTGSVAATQLLFK